MKGIFHTSRRFALSFLVAAAFACGSAWAAPDSPKAKTEDKKEEAVWGEMPAGARTAYIGIHGGTVPVSLLTAGDGSPMIALVGLTGSDFLNFLRSKGKLVEDPPFPDKQSSSPSLAAGSSPTASPSQRPPSVPAGETKAEEMPASAPPVPSESNATLLLAGASSGDIPVIYATGRAFERMSLVPENWAPFGLTEKALSVEGEIKVLAPPKKMPKRHQKKKRR